MIFLLLFIFAVGSVFGMETSSPYCEYDCYEQTIIKPIKMMIDDGISRELKFTINHDPKITISSEIDIELHDVTNYGRDSIKLYITGLGRYEGAHLLNIQREAALKAKKYNPEQYIARIHRAGPFVCFNSPDQGNHGFSLNTATSFGGKNEGETVISVLDVLVNRAKIKHIDVWTICKGTTEFFKALEMLANTQNEYTESFNKLFTTNQEERKENILRALRSVRDFVPLIDVSDPIKQVVQKPSLFIENTIDKIPVSGSIFNHYFLKPVLLDTMTRSFTYFTQNYIFPAITSYEAKQPNVISMLKKIQHTKEKYNWSFIVTSQVRDKTVGNNTQKLNEFYQLLPCPENQKYLLTDSEEGHNACSTRQMQAINAFDKKVGATYYELGQFSLADGEKTLANALKNYQEDPITHICNGYSGVYK